LIDPITIFVSGLSNPVFTPIAAFLDAYGYYLMGVLFLLVLWKFREKRKQLILTMIIVVILTAGLKLALPIQRPCLEGIQSKIACPSENSFPSGHSSTAFGLAFGSLGTVASYAFWPFALLMGFARVYLGVHSFFDVLGSFVVGAIAWLLARIIERRFFGRKK